MKTGYTENEAAQRGAGKDASEALGTEGGVGGGRGKKWEVEACVSREALRWEQY